MTVTGLWALLSTISTLRRKHYFHSLTKSRRVEHLEAKRRFVTEVRKKSTEFSHSDLKRILSLDFEELREELQEGRISVREVLFAYLNRYGNVFM